MNILDGVKFDEKGLVTAIAQDAETNEVLMIAYMNAEALQLTRETGWVYFWSRSRQELWRKGVDRGTVEGVLAERQADEESVREQQEALQSQVRRRFGSEFRRDAVTAERRLTGFLLRRGYDWDSISRMVEMLRSEAEETP